MTHGIRAIEASKITLATFGAIMGAFGVSVWLLEGSKGLFGGPGRPPKGGDDLQPRKNLAGQAQGGVGEGSLGSLGLED